MFEAGTNVMTIINRLKSLTEMLKILRKNNLCFKYVPLGTCYSGKAMQHIHSKLNNLL